MKIPFNRDWLFYRGDVGVSGQRGFTKAGAWWQNGASATLNDSKWQKVHLPHDFMFESEFTKAPSDQTCPADIPEMGTIDSLHSARGSLAGGVAWYRKHFTMPEGSKGKKVYIRFEGVCRDAEVYINQYRVTSHLNGFLGFCADVTDLLAYEGENILAVRVDSTETEGWWYQGGGIYRNVWLDIREPVHFAEDSLFVRSDVDYENKKAKVYVSFDVENHTETPVGYNVRMVTEFITGVVNETAVPISVAHMDKASAELSFELENIELWDCDNPNLYTVGLDILNEKGEVLDSTYCNTGFRDIRYDKDKGFFLNGVPTKMKGVCVHQGHACVGSAEYDGLHEFKIKKLKEMGCNAYRTSHNPVSRELLDTCDRLGMLVMDETRLMSTGNEDREIFEQMIKRDRNHPSVVIWSIGNEEYKIQFTEQANYICRTMTAIAHKLDPTRPTTEALLMWDVEKKILRTDVEISAPVANNVDVVGINYGTANWDNLHKTFGDKPFIACETGTINSTRGAVVRNDELCQITMGYDIAKGETTWKAVAERDYCSGMFAWTGFDYYGEPTPYTYPAVIGAFGIMDVCGFPKYSYYYYKTNWCDGEDTFELAPHWDYVVGGEKRTVYLFSDCDEAELFVNGVSAGRQKIKKYFHAEWKDVEYVPGEITAVGYKNGVETNRKTLATSGKAHRLCAEVEHRSTDANGLYWAIIKLYVEDEKANWIPSAEHKVRMSAEGLTLVGSGNGDPVCHDNCKLPARSLFGGLAQVIVRRDRDAECGKMTFSVSGLESVTLEI